MDERAAIGKEESLIIVLKRLQSVLVAFSGGVDSTYLLSMARKSLGSHVVAVTATSPIHPARETEEAARFARQQGIEHRVVNSTEMGLAEFRHNPPERCYLCKRELFGTLRGLARKEGLAHLVHGANADDLQDYRPGARAAEETGAVAPLTEAGLTKPEIRFLSRRMGLSTWDRPAMACLATRIPYGEPVSEEKLKMISEGEEFLFTAGLRTFRLRHHGHVARIELPPADMEWVLGRPLRDEIIERFHQIGFHHVALDLEGYIPGKMNRELE